MKPNCNKIITIQSKNIHNKWLIIKISISFSEDNYAYQGSNTYILKAVNSHISLAG